MVNGFRPAFAVFLCSIALAYALVGSPAQTPAESQQNTVLQHFRDGQADLQSGHLSEAVEEFKKVLQLEPGLVQAQVNLGLAYHALGNYSLAVSEFSKALKLKPNLLPANLFLGVSYLKLGFPQKAIIPLNRALHIDPSNRVGRQALAMAELSVGHYGKAASQFRRLAAANPDQADKWFGLGQDYLRLSKLLTADLSEQFAHSVWSYRFAGDILGERHLWNDAVAAYRKALDVGPVPEGLHADLGMAYLEAHKTEEAASEFRAELERNSSDPSALLGMAEIELLRGNISASLRMIEVIWKSDPDVLVQEAAEYPPVNIPHFPAREILAELNSLPDQPAQEFLRVAAFRMEADKERARQAEIRFEKSATAMISSLRERRATRSDCDRHQTRLCAKFLASQKDLQLSDILRLGRSYLALGETEAASNAFAEALQRNRKNPEALYWLNRSYLLLSEDCFNHLTALYPNSWRTHELEAEAFHLKQADQDAVKEFQVAERLNPTNAGIHESLGEIFLNQRKFGEAKTELETALRLAPASARGLYLLGRFYVVQREPAKGIPYLESALRQDPTLLEARPVLGMAYLKVGKPSLAIPQLERSAKIDRYGDLHYQLYEAYRQEGRTRLAAQALSRSQELRRQSAAEDQAKLRSAEQ